MNCMDLLTAAASVVFGVYLGKDCYSLLMELFDRAGDKKEPRRFTVCLYTAVFFAILVYMFISVKIPVGTAPL